MDLACIRVIKDEQTHWHNVMEVHTTLAKVSRVIVMSL